MKKSVLVIIGAAMAVSTACSSSKIARNKFSDKNLRVCIDPTNLDANNYARLQIELVKSEAFFVVDRAKGAQAIKREQEMLHRNEADRFEDKEKWSLWGKLYGCGAIVVGQAQCHKVQDNWNSAKSKTRCEQFLQLVDANTGEVRVTGEGESDSDSTFDNYAMLAPDWKEAVENLIEAYPKWFESEDYAKSLQIYQGIAEEEARRQSEIVERNKNRSPTSVQPSIQE